MERGADDHGGLSIDLGRGVDDDRWQRPLEDDEAVLEAVGQRIVGALGDVEQEDSAAPGASVLPGAIPVSVPTNMTASQGGAGVVGHRGPSGGVDHLDDVDADR